MATRIRSLAKSKTQIFNLVKMADTLVEGPAPQELYEQATKTPTEHILSDQAHAEYQLLRSGGTGKTAGIVTTDILLFSSLLNGQKSHG